jgi:hypothetical protein
VYIHSKDHSAQIPAFTILSLRTSICGFIVNDETNSLEFSAYQCVWNSGSSMWLFMIYDNYWFISSCYVNILKPQWHTFHSVYLESKSYTWASNVRNMQRPLILKNWIKVHHVGLSILIYYDARSAKLKFRLRHFPKCIFLYHSIFLIGTYVKHCHSYWEKKTLWGCWSIGCLGRYLHLRGRKRTLEKFAW